MNPPLIDIAEFDACIDLMGPEKIRRLTDALRRQLTGTFEGDDLSETLRQAHVAVSSSGPLGCRRLVTACRAVEDAARDQRGITGPLAILRQVRDDTLLALEGLADRTDTGS